MILLGGGMDMCETRKFVSNNYSVSENKEESVLSGSKTNPQKINIITTF